MLRKLATLATAAATIATLGIGGTPAQAAPATAPAQVARAAAPVAEPRLVDIDIQARNRFDRIVLRFRGGAPELDARYVRAVRLDNGRRVRLPGRAILLLQLDPARARDIERGLQDVDLDNVLAYRVVGDRRGVVRIAVALRQRAAVRIAERDNRLIIDIRNDDDEPLR